MLHKNYGRSHKELWEIATRVIDFDESVNDEDIKIATDSGFVTWDIDCDYKGYFPSPTSEYNFWSNRFSTVVNA